MKMRRFVPGVNRRAVLTGLLAAACPPLATRAARADQIADEAGLLAPLPFDFPSSAASGSGERKVVAHWHWFPRSFDNLPFPDDAFTRDQMSPEGEGGKYRDSGGFILERPLPRPPIAGSDWEVRDMTQDIREASAIGIDAFQFNLAWVGESFIGWRRFLAMQQAVNALGSAFRIMVNLDCNTPPKDNVIDIYVEGIADAFARGGLMTTSDGRLIISAFMADAWPAAFWRRMFDAFAARGIRTAFIPMFLDLSRASDDYLSMTDVVSRWTGNHLGGIRHFASYGRRSVARGKPWMAPIFPQDCRPKDFWYAEAGGSDVFRAGWMAAIEGNAAMADILTWNDYSESSEIRPSTGIQYGFYDLAAYYIAWFKTGTPPAIRRDALYYFHRVQPTDGPELGKRQPRPMTMKYGLGPRNEIELLAFLTEPARLEIETTEGITARDVPAGIQILKANLADGRPTFRLTRKNQVIIELQSAFTIRSSSDYQDLLYRSGSSIRAPVDGLAEGRT